MKVILDTCTFLWLCEADVRLSARAQQVFQDPENQVFLSSASAWEISLKYALGKLPLTEAPDSYVPRMRQLHQVTSLPVTEEEAIRAGQLPLLHRDPFDRLLVGQAITQGCVLLTPDPMIAQYSVQILW